jgi:hypothetical protein
MSSFKSHYTIFNGTYLWETGNKDSKRCYISAETSTYTTT